MNVSLCTGLWKILEMFPQIKFMHKNIANKPRSEDQSAAQIIIAILLQFLDRQMESNGLKSHTKQLTTKEDRIFTNASSEDSIFMYAK